MWGRQKALHGPMQMQIDPDTSKISFEILRGEGTATTILSRSRIYLVIWSKEKLWEFNFTQSSSFLAPTGSLGVAISVCHSHSLFLRL